MIHTSAKTERGTGTKARGKAWSGVLKNSWKGVQQIDTSQLTALGAVRSTIGFALPMIWGISTQHVEEGVLMGVGATMLGSIGIASTHRTRRRQMLMACLAVTCSALVGSLVGSNDWLTILAVSLWGFGAGLLAALGQPMVVLGTQATVMLMVMAHFRASPLDAVLSAGLILSGAVVQTVLALIPVPGLRAASERAVLATAYEALANYAGEPANKECADQVKDALFKARTLLTESDDRSRQGRLLLGLLEMAEELRMSLLVLRRSRRELVENADVPQESLEYVDQILLAVSLQLREIVRGLCLRTRFISKRAQHQQAKRALQALGKLECAEKQKQLIQPVLIYGRSLREQMHRLRKLARAWSQHQYRYASSITVPTTPPRQHPWSLMRANLTPRSTIFRHAIRLSVALLLSTAFYRLINVPLMNDYWISMTVIIVLKPDFNATISRSLARALGTILGAFVITLLVSLLAPSQSWLLILSITAIYCGYALLYANYALFSLFFTAAVIILLAFVTPQPVELALYRAIDTGLGAALAMCIFLLWPTWESEQVLKNLANRLEVLRQYGQAILQGYASPSYEQDAHLYTLRSEALLARSNAQASVERALKEPGPLHIDAEMATGLLEAENKLGQSLLVLEAYLENRATGTAQPAMSYFARQVDLSLSQLASSMASGQKVPRLPNLRRAWHNVKQSENSTPIEAEDNLTYSIVQSESNQLVRTISTISELLNHCRGKAE